MAAIDRFSPGGKSAPVRIRPAPCPPELAGEHRHEPADYELRTEPSVFYGPNGESQIFQPDDLVPEGWEDHPRKVADFVDPDAEPAPLDL